MKPMTRRPQEMRYSSTFFVPKSQRTLEGSIASALVVERNVLEWRFDPASDSRLPVATAYDLEVIVFCSEGYSSSLAAAALQDLGLLARDGHNWWISRMARNRSADCAATLGS